MVGGIAAGSLTAGAATPSPSPGTSQPGAVAKDCPAEPREHHRGHPLGLTGTVTAVGSNTVTIKTASGTKTFRVDSASDIDKNGEAKLSSLVVGDAVRFSVRSGTSTIDKLHAGEEAKNRPSGRGSAPGKRA